MSNAGGDTLHRIPDSPFAIWEAPKGGRAPRFTVIEPGAGRRGMGRRRGQTRTMAGAEELAATLKPSTPAEILAHIETWDDRDRHLMGELLRLSQPGTKLWIICDGCGYEAVSEGLAVSGTEALFGGENELSCWLIRWRAADGTEDKGQYAVALEDAERAWWILAEDGRVRAGGPPIFDHGRALEIAAEFGGRAVQGIAELPRKAA